MGEKLEADALLRFVEERAASYGGLRQVAPTAIALDRAAAMIRALTATPDRSDDALAEDRAWQPIETAPRDGTEFLALVSNGWYALVSAPAEALREGWPYQWWRSNDRQSYPVVDTHSADSEWGSRLLLTHWMHLPPAPRAALKGHGL